MSLNGNLHFSQVPKVNIRRSVFKQPFNHKFTFDYGKLIPFYVQECIPGSTYNRKKDTFVLRMTTPSAPIMDESFLDVYYFFVPFRLVWNHSEHFFARTKENDYVPLTEYKVPQTYVYGTETCSVHDYMGVPTKVSKASGQSSSINEGVSSLYARAYALIWNEYFRSEELQNSILIDKSDSNHAYVNISQGYLNGAQYGGALCPVDKYHDYFTSALLRPLRNATGVPVISELAEVHGFDSSGTAPITFNNLSSGSPITPSSAQNVQLQASTGFLSSGGAMLDPNNLYAKVEADISQLRQSFMLQRMFEKDNLFGGRYTSVLYGHYGVNAPDARLQRPEFIGGLRTPINVQQIMQESETENTPLGYPGAYSVTAKHDRNVFHYTSLEHGCIIGVCCARTKNSYQQGIERFLSRQNRTDFYFPVMSGLSEQAILNKEIYLSGAKTTDDQVFGYQEYASDYKYKPDRISGYFRSNASGSLDFYHYAENYASTPTLSDTWIKQGTSNVDRTLIQEGAWSNHLICEFECTTICVLPMPVFNVPGALTHMF